MSCLGRSFQESHVPLTSQLFAFFCLNCTLILQIFFISYKDATDVGTAVLFDFTHPIGYLGERVLIRNIISNDNAVSSAIIACCNCFEAVLACGIPDLEFDCLPINVNSLNLEVYPNSWLVHIIERVISESQHQ